jgi:hypothetical protein
VDPKSLLQVWVLWPNQSTISKLAESRLELKRAWPVVCTSEVLAVRMDTKGMNHCCWTGKMRTIRMRSKRTGSWAERMMKRGRNKLKARNNLMEATSEESVLALVLCMSVRVWHSIPDNFLQKSFCMKSCQRVLYMSGVEVSAEVYRPEEE